MKSIKLQNLFKFLLLICVCIVSTIFLYTNLKKTNKEKELITYSINNEIILPSNLYLLDSISNRIFFQPLAKRWKPNDYIIRATLDGNYIHLENKLLLESIKDSSIINLALIDYNTFDTIQNISSRINISKPYNSKDSISIQFLGDSYTQGLYFKKAIIDWKYVPNVKLIGSRNFDGIKHEGRGGWTLKNYFSNKKTNDFFYNPFFQPDGDLKYWGTTAFWKNCISLNTDKNKKSFNITYNCKGYDISGYGKDGRRLIPQVNDLMWDSNKNSYIIWDGEKWAIKDSIDNLSWNFNYKKYLEMYNFDKPDILVVMLGLNDFRSGTLNPNFSEWNKQMNVLFKSYKTAVPNGKMIICIPCSSCGVMDNKEGNFTKRQNAIMWEVRKNIIKEFDKREDEGLYIVDTAITIDNENGYNKDDKGIQIGNPHPYLDYPEIGKPIAAIIQYIRNL